MGVGDWWVNKGYSRDPRLAQAEERVWNALQRLEDEEGTGLRLVYLECLRLWYSLSFMTYRCRDGFAVYYDGERYYIRRIREWADGTVGWDLVTITGNDVPIDKIIARMRGLIRAGRARKLMRIRWGP